MKTVTITVSCEEAKLGALRLYLSQKQLTVEEELEKSLEGLYQKAVPGNVREFLDLSSGTPVQKAAKPPRDKKPKTLPSPAVAAGGENG